MSVTVLANEFGRQCSLEEQQNGDGSEQKDGQNNRAVQGVGAGEVSGATLKSPRRVLDKNHGFMRRIIHNQIDRDEYDKLQRRNSATATNNNLEWTVAGQGARSGGPDANRGNKFGSNSSRRKRNDRELYVPPHARRANSQQGRTEAVNLNNQGQVEDDVRENSRSGSAKSLEYLDSQCQDDEWNLDRLSICPDPETKQLIDVVKELAAEDSEVRLKIREKLQKSVESKTKKWVPLESHHAPIATGVQQSDSNSNGIVPSCTGTAEGSLTSQNKLPKPKDPLFELELMDKQGSLHAVHVHQSDTPARIAKIFAQKMQLTDQQANRLRLRVETEMRKRGIQF